MAREKIPLRVGGREMYVSNLDQVLFPKTGFTKAQLIDYYIKIADTILPHLKNRPITLKLYYHGVDSPADYEKDAPFYTPAWVRRAPIWRKNGESQIQFVLVNDLPSLVWSANLANIEMHPFIARWPRIDRPDWMVFDLDPGEPANVLDAARVALSVRELLDDLKLTSFVKTAGSKGLHLYIPFNTAVSYQQTQALAKAIAELLEHNHPELVVSQMAKEVRKGKVFVDWSQNAEHKSTVSVYSLRARGAEPYVSLPMDWEELSRAVKAKDPRRFCIAPEDALKMVDRGDLFEPVLKMKQKFPRSALARGRRRTPVAARG
jgi:bifunctional non-homologous end joining protein LigD